MGSTLPVKVALLFVLFVLKMKVWFREKVGFIKQKED